MIKIFALPFNDYSALYLFVCGEIIIHPTSKSGNLPVHFHWLSADIIQLSSKVINLSNSNNEWCEKGPCFHKGPGYD